MPQPDREMGIVVNKAGGPDALEWVPLESPLPGPGEVRIAQRAIGVNFIDTYFRSGLYPWPSSPLIPGAEAAGVVTEVGPGVEDLSVGDRVAYTMPLGAYRTRRTVSAERLVKLPDEVDFDVAASVMLKGLTAQFLLTSCHRINEGDTVLVHAAAGGVGLLLGQWLKLFGATSIGTVGSPEKAALAKANGYDHVIDYRTEDFVARVKDITGARGCDVVYDSVGKDTWRGSLKCLRLRGMFVHFGQSSGMIADFKFSDLASGGSLYATRPMLFDYIKSREDLTARAGDLFGRIAAGEIKAHVGQRMPLREAAAAHRELEARRTMGSTVLTVD
ncbi:MAG TPA: quinone oxidoreductase [Steroidobacteraceae bacterium]|jgi:NADPH2:quinone reductase|nr:quinone oxidoreductase [Steroidobacteraceae bacterium]